MAHGDPNLSPFTFRTVDYMGRVFSITVPFDNATKDILNGTVVHRDVGCLYSTVVFSNPSGPLRKQLPSAPEGDSTFTAQQVRIATGFQTYTDIVNAGQITAEV
jgi:hypothetical protein